MGDNPFADKNNYTTNTFRANNNEHVPPQSKYEGTPILDNQVSGGVSPHPLDDKYRVLSVAIKRLGDMYTRQGIIYADFQQRFVNVQNEIQSLTFLIDILMDDKADSQVVKYIADNMRNPPCWPEDDHYYQIARIVKEHLNGCI